MTSQKQIEANQTNALSGGVKTEEGKSISRLNAIKHGFFSKIAIEKDKIASNEFCEDVYKALSPNNLYESQLVEIILSTLLSFRRICIVESHFVDSSMTQYGDGRPDNAVFLEKNKNDSLDVLLKFQKYKTSSLNMTIKMYSEFQKVKNGFVLEKT